MKVVEANFDGLVGPTHNYSGLAFGNMAAQENRLRVSNPRKAALQGLEKMRLLAGLGLVQGVLPPRERPKIEVLRALGFHGSDEAVVSRAGDESPNLLHEVCSSSAMWAANCATVTPSADSTDGRVHITPANLASHFHRSLEGAESEKILRRVFPDDDAFCIHPPLPAHAALGDEGAANHLRLCSSHADVGINLFTYGFRPFSRRSPRPQRRPARQSYEASAALPRLHRLKRGKAILAQQNPKAIDQGAFHTDVVAVANENLLLIHQEALRQQAATLRRLNRTLGGALHVVEVPSRSLSLSRARKTYLFNSQIVTQPDGGMVLIAPKECTEFQATVDIMSELKSGSMPVKAVQIVDLRQSMQNGGGPACLRLRVVLKQSELSMVNHRCILSEVLYEELVDFVNRHYRDRLHPRDLSDPKLVRETFTALDELTQLLALGSVYDFQR